MVIVLVIIAALWMADGVALLIAPDRVISLLKDAMAQSSALFKWSGLAAVLGVCLLLGTAGLPYRPLWVITGMVMVVKGVFLLSAPEPSRQAVVDWCLQREAVDYRLWGIGLCTLSVLLLDALGWLGIGD